MKKMLLSVLLFAASVIMAQAQGFRVHRSDGAVYEFSVVADSIVFFDGEGDPNYQEPVPDYILDAINQLQAYCDNLKATCAENQDVSQWNAEMIKELAQQLDIFKTDLQEVRVGCEAQFGNSDRISNLEEVLSAVKAQNEKTYARVAALEADVVNLETKVANLETKVANFMDELMLLLKRDAEKDAIINALYERIAALEAKVNQ